MKLQRPEKVTGLLTVSLSLLLLTGCAVGPDYERAELPVSTVGSYQNAPVETEESGNKISMSRWWEEIDDHTFVLIVTQLLEENPSLLAAAERTIQANERRIIQGGSRLPSVSLDGSGGRAFSRAEVNGNSDRVYANSYSANANVSWTFDLFGQVKRNIEASEASFQAAIADEEALKHALIAELLSRRVSIAVNQRLLTLAEENAQNRQTFYTLVQQRYDLGTASTALSDVYLAEDNLASVESEVADFQRLLTDEIYRLDTLLGQPPGTTQLNGAAFPLLANPPDAPLSVPAELLDRRPDLRASELRVAAANANVGVAIADLYPQFQIVGSLGVDGSSTNNLFSSDQLAGSLFASLSQKLFAGGALRANIRLAESSARELAHLYAADILEALREVESALQTDKQLAEQLTSQTRSLEALRQAEELSEARYLDGLLSLQAFLETQQRRYRAEQSWLLTQQQRWNSRITLFLALGGDWLNSTSPQIDE